MKNASAPLLVVRGLSHEFVAPGGGAHARRRRISALVDVSFDLHEGEVLGLVGETGSGKTTLVRALVHEPPPQSGSVHLRSHDLGRLRGRELVERRREMQMVFQDPFGSLNPRWSVASIVEDPLICFRLGTRAERRRRVDALLDQVGLAGYGRRQPHELSGGECQRVAIARAIATRPALLICDEAVASLDVLIQAQVLELFRRLRDELGVAYLFISHDLLLVRGLSDRIAILHAGQLCEIGRAESVYSRARHPYTAALMACAEAPSFAQRSEAAATLQAEPPSPSDPPSGCRFRMRCAHAAPRCAAETPQLHAVGSDHAVACHFPLT